MVASFNEPVLNKSVYIFNASELRKGTMFHTKKELMRVVKDVHIDNHQEIKVLKSDSGVWEVECKRKVTGCVWMLRVRKRAIHNFFEIMEIKGPHTCVNPNISQDHYNLSSTNIAHVISTQIAADPSVSEKVLEATVVSHFGYRPSRRKIRHARKMTEKAIFKSSEESYEYLPKFMNALLSFNHGTIVDWYFKEHDLGEPIVEVVTFKRVFWALKPCIDAFQHCIPVLLIDGTHMYDKYGGVLLTATTVDGFNHLLPVAFAVVEGENKASWSWFMERVKKKIVLQRRDVCVISDRHKGIISVMNNPELGWCEPLSHHRFCSRHLAANFRKEFKRGLKDSIVPLCRQLTGPKFSRHWNALVAAEPRVEEWFADKPLNRWALAFDEGQRFGIMTTNMAESWNSAIKVARKLPIAALVKTIFHKLVAYFDQRRIEVEKQCVDGSLFTLHANKMLNRWKERTSGHYVKVFDRDTWVFTVTTLKRGQKGDCTSLVSKWYRLDNARNVYGSAFEPLPDENAWPLFDTFPKMGAVIMPGFAYGEKKKHGFKRWEWIIGFVRQAALFLFGIRFSVPMSSGSFIPRQQAVAPENAPVEAAAPVTAPVQVVQL
ncbi:uncharacterized protein LOC141718366 [Apium graveolens]|uniref:uncharacterized protein LOC141718366 n=1 Tax=Apium graveolens TaxID=4045 RepID=UPI003D7AD55E